MGLEAKWTCDWCGDRQDGHIFSLQGRIDLPPGWIFTWKNNTQGRDEIGCPSLVCCGREGCKISLWKEHHPAMYEHWKAERKAMTP